MSLAIDFLFVAMFIILYTLIIEIFTILFRLTGLTHDKAHFQVISMLTNSGFTTYESEIILSSRRRRRLAKITMIFGYSFTVIIVSSIVNVFLSLSNAEIEDILPTILSVAVTIILAFLLYKSKPVHAKLDRFIEIVGNRIMFGKNSNPILLIDLYGSKAMTEISLDHVPDFLQDTPLSKSSLREKYDIQVLYIKRGDATSMQIDGDTVLQENDLILTFGNYKNIRQLFERKAD